MTATLIAAPGFIRIEKGARSLTLTPNELRALAHRGADLATWAEQLVLAETGTHSDETSGGRQERPGSKINVARRQLRFSSAHKSLGRGRRATAEPDTLPEAVVESARLAVLKEAGWRWNPLHHRPSHGFWLRLYPPANGRKSRLVKSITADFPTSTIDAYRFETAT